MKTVSIIGIGRVGGALALALDKKGYKIEKTAARSRENFEKIKPSLKSQPEISTIENLTEIDSQIVFITTQDGEIQKTGESLKTKISKDAIVLHMSGALSSDVLSVLRENGNAVGSMHPLVSISDAFLGEKRFKNAYFCLEGDETAVRIAETIVEDLQGNSFSIETRYKTLYHAAAVTACGHLVAVIDSAIEMLEKCGLQQPEAQKILLPLIKSTIENLETQNTAEALTGTFARVDAATFERHLGNMRENVSDEILEIYLLLGLRSLKLAEKRGADQRSVENLRKEIMLAKNLLKC